MLARIAAKAGIERRVVPHQLRHTHAAELVAEGVSIGVSVVLAEKPTDMADLR